MMDDTTAAHAAIPSAVAITRGIHHCRHGEWYSGLHYLQMAHDRPEDQTLPGLAYSFLGLAVARCEHRHADATTLCEHAVEVGFYEPENYVNLALVRILAHDRGGALAAISRGLAVDPRHEALRELQRELGQRRPPVLSFLPRTHPLNQWLGRMRHSWHLRHARHA
jgi:hypothetical protein